MNSIWIYFINVIYFCMYSCHTPVFSVTVILICLLDAQLLSVIIGAQLLIMVVIELKTEMFADWCLWKRW